MFQGEHSAILSTFIKLPVVIKTFVLSFLSGRFIQVLLYAFMYVVLVRQIIHCFVNENVLRTVKNDNFLSNRNILTFFHSGYR